MLLHSAEMQGRVKSIKCIFENLNSSESLDVSTKAATTAAIARNHQWKSSPKFLMKRSLTTTDFRSKCNNSNKKNNKNDNNNNNIINNITGAGNAMDSNEKGIKKSSYLRRHNNFDRTVSVETYSIRKRTNNCQKASAEDAIKPLKELKENVEVRLTPHNNDTIKRSSIKRTPAFRYGTTDKCNNSTDGNTSKRNEKSRSNKNNNDSDDVNFVKTQSIVENMFSSAKELKLPERPNAARNFLTKINEMLERSENDKSNDPGLTDTLKTFLMQPLPEGPAPQKPPRTFQANNTNSSSHKSSNEIKQKIDSLENQLIFEPSKATQPSLNSHKTRIWRSTKDKSTNNGSSPFGSSLRNCIVPCSDTIFVDDKKSTIKVLSTATIESNVRNSEQTLLSTNKGKSKTHQRRLSNGIRKSSAEHIYMEPFAHMKQNKSGSRTLSNQTNNDTNGSVDGDNLSSSLVSCMSCSADDHPLPNIHYMCTSIENKIKSSDSESNEIDHSSLKTPYDEINRND